MEEVVTTGAISRAKLQSIGNHTKHKGWYHFWWPWLTSKRVVRFVSDSWVSCYINLLYCTYGLGCNRCTRNPRWWWWWWWWWWWHDADNAVADVQGTTVIRSPTDVQGTRVIRSRSISRYVAAHAWRPLNSRFCLSLSALSSFIDHALLRMLLLLITLLLPLSLLPLALVYHALSADHWRQSLNIGLARAPFLFKNRFLTLLLSNLNRSE